MYNTLKLVHTIRKGYLFVRTLTWTLCARTHAHTQTHTSLWECFKAQPANLQDKGNIDCWKFYKLPLNCDENNSLCISHYCSACTVHPSHTHTQSQFTLINSKWAGITIVLSRLLRHSKSFTLQSTLTHLHTQSYTVCDTERYMGEVWSSQWHFDTEAGADRDWTTNLLITGSPLAASVLRDNCGRFTVNPLLMAEIN